MLHKTKAIILHSIKYSESSVIAYCYTEHFGRVSLLIPGVRKKNSRIKQNVLQPLQINEIDFYHKEKPGLTRLKEIHSCHYSDNILFDTRKSTIALFLAEILYKTLKEEVKNAEQYHFIEENIKQLDNLEKNRAVFYLKFLINYTLYLGFYPNRENMGNARFFDLKNGVFTTSQPNHDFFVKGDNLSYLKFLLENEEGDPAIRIPSNVRDTMLDVLLDYFIFHMEGMSGIKSVQVLKDVFH